MKLDIDSSPLNGFFDHSAMNWVDHPKVPPPFVEDLNFAMKPIPGV
jgi:hypothetical protein